MAIWLSVGTPLAQTSHTMTPKHYERGTDGRTAFYVRACVGVCMRVTLAATDGDRAS